MNENFISMPPPTVQPSGVEARNGREDRNPAVVNGARVHVRLEPTVGKAAGCVQQGAGADKYAAAAAERTESFQRLVDDRRSAGAGSAVKAKSTLPALYFYFRGYMLVILGIILLMIKSPNRRIVPLNRIHVGFVEYSADERFAHIWCGTESMLNQIYPCMTPFNH